MIGLVTLMAMGASSAASSQSLAFDIPRHFVCDGSDRANKPVHIDVVIKGGPKGTVFVLSPIGASAWPKKAVTLPPTNADSLTYDKPLWWWVATSFSVDGEEWGFGFDIPMPVGRAPGAIRFSRSKYDPSMGSDDFKMDPKGAYTDDVPCSPVVGQG